MRIRIYISVILILIQKSTSEAVSPPSPANVSIHCDNYGVEVRWEYPDLSPDTHFFVEVLDRKERKNYTTQNLSLNISSMLVTSLTKVYYVTVTAVRRGQESKLSKSEIFSFNADATSAKIKCYLDFPEVELSSKEGKLHVRFINPLKLYRNTPALRELLYDLEYTVETNESVNNATCDAKAETCETSTVFFEYGKKYCVNLTGEIARRKLNLRSTCVTIYQSFTVYLYPVLVVVLTLLFITAIIMLLVKKCYSGIKKKSMAAFPNFLVFKPTPTHLCEPLKLYPEAVASDLRIEPKEQTTLIEMSSDEETCSDEEPSCGHKDVGSSDLGDINPYGDNNDLDEADPGDASVGYDCPHVLRLEMSPGDIVKGYGL